MTQSELSNQPAVTVVGIGASAGGVEALSAFFDHETEQPRAAYLVAMHLARERPSHLPEILSRHTGMRLLLAENGMPVEERTIYVIPPGQVMTVQNGMLDIAPINPMERVPTVIDRMFNSMAEAYGEHAIGVVLSGTGADGALGLKAIKERGGLTIAQGEDGSTPLFSGMPRSAIAAGVIDLQLPVEKIPARIAEMILATNDAGQKQHDEVARHREESRLAICALLLTQTGHDFSGYKPSTFYRRMYRRMHVLQLATMDKYLERLRHTPGEVTMLFRDLLISVTSFFRDIAAFALLEQQVMPALFKGKDSQAEIRVWVPGCATGEEAYSLGILLLECLDKLGGNAPEVRIFATDIDEHALSIARKARYPSVLLEDVSDERRKRFFDEDRGHFTVRKRLRDICTFSPHNALRDPPFSRIDLVSCRNLLIYLGPEFQDRILPILHYALRPDGFLFVGIAEGASRHGTLFTPVSKEHRIYQRLPNVTAGLSLPLLTKSGKPAITRSFEASVAASSSNAMRRQIEARMLQAHTPPYVLVNGRSDALFYSARTGNYLEFPSGAPSRHLLSNARKELRLGLRHALQEVVNTQLKVELPEVVMPRDDVPHRVQVTIEPFDDGETPLYLVVFNDHGVAPKLPLVSQPADIQTVEHLDRELRDTREQLQSTYEEFETAIEELRVANEELMSLNEELQSSNEELETSKEELQSVNEELQTVNSEMTHNVEALDQANADLQGLLENTGIATIFLDRDLGIRSYTQAATELFTLIPSDRGRLITDLAHQLDAIDLRQNLENTLVRRTAMEIAVSRRDGQKHYLMCILPYAGEAEETGGVVMTFVEVTALISADARHKTMIGELNHRVRNMLAVVSAMASQTLADHVEAEAFDAFLNRLHAMARTYKLLTETDWSYMSFRGLLKEELGVIAGSTRYSLDGPPLKLHPREALALGMVIHELATNALKYGALSNQDGHINITWACIDDSAKTMEIHWSETGGPPVGPPSHRGFGTLLVDRQLAYELNGHSDITYAAEGLQLTLRVPRLQKSETKIADEQ
ncbi:chemotaxis protein CheB [Rhodanobacter sp. L36]|uniref:chemotaxis protein CheB n=1 Tax=Rhodanobacter sp. L36 TaxID=1747221 RepID=UPI00131C2BFA|nr:chemotaxis protein CheB [Rhodanobacter sp. L36]